MSQKTEIQKVSDFITEYYEIISAEKYNDLPYGKKQSYQQSYEEVWSLYQNTDHGKQTILTKKTLGFVMRCMGYPNRRYNYGVRLVGIRRFTLNELKNLT